MATAAPRSPSQRLELFIAIIIATEVAPRAVLVGEVEAVLVTGNARTTRAQAVGN